MHLSGSLNETVHLSGLRTQLRGNVTFDLGGVTHINSCGVREWVNLVRDLPNVRELRLTHCTPAVVMQLNMVRNFCGPAQVVSMYGPYICEKCGESEDKLVQASQVLRKQLAVFPCSTCMSPMVFDELFDRYFAFLLDP